MKTFQFPLERVLAWRRTQARLEESKLEALLAQDLELQAALSRLQAGSDQSHQDVLVQGYASGEELGALDAFRQHTQREQQRTGQARSKLQAAMAQQKIILSQRRRELRLLEILREQRWSGWSAEAAKEIDQQAEDSFLARWKQP